MTDMHITAVWCVKLFLIMLFFDVCVFVDESWIDHHPAFAFSSVIS